MILPLQVQNHPVVFEINEIQFTPASEFNESPFSLCLKQADGDCVYQFLMSRNELERLRDCITGALGGVKVNALADKCRAELDEFRVSF